MRFYGTLIATNRYREQDDNGKWVDSPAVEADKSLFTHLTGIEGDFFAAQCWVVGIIERGTQNFILRAVGAERNSEKMLQIFEETVHTTERRRTRVYTDGAHWFPILSKHNFKHTAVPHTNGTFATGINTTSRIEGLWGTLKYYGRFNKGQSYSTIADVQLVLDELKWRYQNRNEDLALRLGNLIGEYSTEQIIRQV